MSNWRGRAMDVVTLLILAGAVGVFAYRSTSTSSSEGKSSAQQEAALLAVRLDTLRVMSAGDSASHLIDFRSDSATVLVMFTTTCPYCKQTKPEWERIARTLPASVRMIALTNEPRNPEVTSYFTAPRIHAMIPASVGQFMKLFPIEVVPVTLAIRSGKVLAAHVGVGSAVDVDRVVKDFAMSERSR